MFPMEALVNFNFRYTSMFMDSMNHRVSRPYACNPRIRILTYDEMHKLPTILLTNIPKENPEKLYKIDPGKIVMIVDVTDKEKPKLLYEFPHLANKPCSYSIIFTISGAMLRVEKVEKMTDLITSIVPNSAKFYHL